MADPLDTSDRAQLSVREVADRFIAVFYHQNRLVEAFRAWVHPDYVQHDPNSATGRDGTIEALDAHMKRSPGMSHDVKRVIYGAVENGGGLVAVHYHFRHKPEDRGMAVVDLFRIEDGYLVEHWDIIQPIPDPSTAKNNNGMF
jgi:predicted SnoaL-like aldol condensation-catalyzing enzyme